MARGAPHPDRTRAAVLAALLTGQSVHQVAAEHHVGTTTARRWRDRYLASFLGAKLDKPDKPDRLVALVHGYLVAALTTARAQVEQFRDRQWLRRQRAAEAAVLHGVLVDKALRILAALETATEGGGSGRHPGMPG